MIGGTNCKTDAADNRNKNCWFWLKVIDSHTLELYRDAALTQKVDLTGGSSGMYAGRTTFTIAKSCGTGSQSCRGQFDTTAADHPAGAVATRLLIAPVSGRDPYGDADGSHAVYYSTGLSIAVDIDAATTDSITGETITAARAYEQNWGSMGWKDRFGGRVNCAGTNISTCDNPVWGIRPRHRIRDAAIGGGEGERWLNYTAPTGDSCRVGISSAPFESTDDSGDPSDGQVVVARSFPLEGLTAGKKYYRITCGPGGGTARVSGTFTAGVE
jgi:hypothetical protein